MNKFYCKGRWSISGGKKPCIDEFEHYGENGDKELVDHQTKEKDLNSKSDWWTGFDTDKRFENLKEQSDKIKEQKKR